MYTLVSANLSEPLCQISNNLVYSNHFGGIVALTKLAMEVFVDMSVQIYHNDIFSIKI